MNIHPYRAMGFSPEKGNLEEDIINLKKLMKKYNDEKKEFGLVKLAGPRVKDFRVDG